MLYFGYFLCLQLSVSALPEEKGTENMKINYEFINGEKTEIEVDENIGTWILDSRRVEENLARKERYHCYSSDAAWEGEDYAAPDTPESLILRKYENKRLISALDELTEVQKRRFIKFAEGISIREIARQEGTNFKSVYDSIEQARKKLKKLL